MRFSIVLLAVLLFLFSACSDLSSGDTVTGQPSLSASFIDQVLSANNSPAVGTGQVFYQQSESRGIDDAYALAFFQHESSFGKYGVASLSLNIGNLRCLGPDYADLKTWCQNDFAYFPSWSSSIVAWYRLIRGPLYVGSGLTTVPQIVDRYAPTDDSNSPSSYVSAVEASVSIWRQGKLD